MIHGKDEKLLWSLSKNGLLAGVPFFKMHWDNKRKKCVLESFL
jgi:hypothetical protein